MHDTTEGLLSSRSPPSPTPPPATTMADNVITPTANNDNNIIHRDHAATRSLAYREQPYSSNDNWVEMNAYDHSTSPMHEYGNYVYMAPISHGVSSPEVVGGMPPPPPLPSLQSHHSGHHDGGSGAHIQPPVLIMPPHAAWPSMLTNPQNFPAQSEGTKIHMPSPVSAKQRIPGVTQLHQRTNMNENKRITLTDPKRKLICLYRIRHPEAKQTEIAAIFGVERSTVSKVLRNSEKYLASPEVRSSSPVKRSKGKFPDIERALASWVRKAQHSGADLSDSEIWEKARHFARGLGDDNEGHVKMLSSSWLDKFKQKHGIGAGGRLMRRASETNMMDSARLPSMSMSSMSSMSSSTMAAMTPLSPSGDPSPSSATRSDDELRDSMPFLGFESGDGGSGGGGSGNYKHANSQSTTSLSSSTFTDGPSASSFSTGAMSPGGTTFTFSPDPNVGGFLQGDHHHQDRQLLPPGAFQRPRSQTLPTLDLEYFNQTASAAGGNNNNSHNNYNGCSNNDDKNDDNINSISNDGRGARANGQGSITPRYPSSNENAIVSDTESPDQETRPQPFGMESAATMVASPPRVLRPTPRPATSTPRLRHSSSTGSIGSIVARSTTPITTSVMSSSLSSLSSSFSSSFMGGGSSPSSPSCEDARRAADLLLSFIQSQGSAAAQLVDDHDYMAVLRLTEKLRVRSTQSTPIMPTPSSSLSDAHSLLGGLPRIPEGDNEMAPPMSLSPALTVKSEMAMAT